jgi:hypothetical protein
MYYTSMLYFHVFAKLHPRLHPQPALPRPRFLARSISSVSDRLPQHSNLQLSNILTRFIQPLCIQSLTHSFAQRAAHICFPFNHFRTPSIATDGVTAPAALWISPRPPIPHFLPPIPFLFILSSPEPKRGDRTITQAREVIPFVFILFRTLLHFFALKQNSTLLFSIDSELFAKNTRGWG